MALKSQDTWMKEIAIAETTTVNWEKAYLLACKCTKERKLREFQFKFLHRRIATNDFLYKTGLKLSAEKKLKIIYSCGVNSQNPFGENFLDG